MIFVGIILTIVIFVIFIYITIIRNTLFTGKCFIQVVNFFVKRPHILLPKDFLIIWDNFYNKLSLWNYEICNQNRDVFCLEKSLKFIDDERLLNGNGLRPEYIAYALAIRCRSDITLLYGNKRFTFQGTKWHDDGTTKLSDVIVEENIND